MNLMKKVDNDSQKTIETTEHSDDNEHNLVNLLKNSDIARISKARNWK